MVINVFWFMVGAVARSLVGLEICSPCVLCFQTVECLLCNIISVATFTLNASARFDFYGLRENYFVACVAAECDQEINACLMIVQLCALILALLDKVWILNHVTDSCHSVCRSLCHNLGALPGLGV